jgi:hypothetical protein
MTQSDHRVLADGQRAPIFDGVRGLISDNGGRISVPRETFLLLARARGGRVGPEVYDSDAWLGAPGLEEHLDRSSRSGYRRAHLAEDLPPVFRRAV